MAIKVLVVDDEPHIRKILQTVISRNTAFEVVAGCDNMTDALLEFNDKKPQVVFMDIEIKGSSGIDCAKVMSQLNSDVKIIFATAHSEYMANAFELYAFDYLVKPFDMQRIEHTLERLEHHFANGQNMFGGENLNGDGKVSLYEGNPASANISQSGSVSSAEKNPAISDSRILIKGKDTVNFVDVADIVMFERQNNSTHIYTKSGEEYVTSASLADFSEKLDENIFVRSHKSYIINVAMIKRIEQYGSRTFSVLFKGISKDALITKEKYDQIKNMYE